MAKFSVTYEIFLPHEDWEDVCEADEAGFISENVSLRDAIHDLGGHASEASDSRIDSARWFTAYGERNWCDGATENRSLHIPGSVTASSRKRIARLLRVKGA